MSSYGEFAKGALPAIILALIIVSAFHIYLPTQTEKPSYSNISITITPSLPSYHTSSQSGTEKNYFFAYSITILLAILLSSSVYFILRKSYS
jgi:hypothetical protein